MQRGGLPLSVRLALGILRFRSQVLAHCDVIEVHRMEPAILLASSRARISAIFHQNMSDLYDSHSDIGWKRFPALYFAIERFAVNRLRRVFCVRLDAVHDYVRRYPSASEKFQFISTWYDSDVFSPPSESLRSKLRSDLQQEFRLTPNQPLLISVGRLDRQKNPELLVRGFYELCKRGSGASLLIVGDGVLRPELGNLIDQLGLVGRIHLLGVRTAREISSLLKASDLYVMSSAYEGMPISVLEALATGIPVVSTAVGEVPRLVIPGYNGELVLDHTPSAFCDAILKCLDHRVEDLIGAASASATSYAPARVLGQLFQSYRNLCT
ncbi:MAG: hypothetical protein RIQ60_2288 [Pseudomonadota bacterium]